MSPFQNNPATPSPLRTQVQEPHGSQSPLLNHQAHHPQEPPTPTPTNGNMQIQVPESPVSIPFPRLSTDQYPSGYPRRRATNDTPIWGPPPPARSYEGGNNYELQRRTTDNNNNYPHEYDGYSYGDLQPLTTQNEYSNQGYDSPQHRNNRPSYYTGKPRHNKASSIRSLRFDPKRRSYRLDALSDIDSEGAFDNRPRQHTQEGSVPPDEILRLPLTWWMNSDAKNRMYQFVPFS